MIDATGTSRFEYEDVLRAIGRFIDENNLREVCIIELKEGILLRGLQFAANRGGFQTISESYLFTNEDIEKLVEDAYNRRNTEVKPRKGLFNK